jgi:hypothetical protein
MPIWIPNCFFICGEKDTISRRIWRFEMKGPRTGRPCNVRWSPDFN